jgi:hypothetical protein
MQSATRPPSPSDHQPAIGVQQPARSKDIRHGLPCQLSEMEAHSPAESAPQLSDWIKSIGRRIAATASTCADYYAAAALYDQLRGLSDAELQPPRTIARHAGTGCLPDVRSSRLPLSATLLRSRSPCRGRAWPTHGGRHSMMLSAATTLNESRTAADPNQFQRRQIGAVCEHADDPERGWPISARALPRPITAWPNWRTARGIAACPRCSLIA